MGADLGAKNAMGVVELETNTKTETNFLLTNKMWQRWTQHDKFERKRKSILAKYLSYVKSEELMLLRRHGERPSNKSIHFRSFVKHKLKLLIKEDEFDFGENLSKLHFQQYSAKQRAFTKLRKFIRGKSNVVLFIVGHSPIHANSPIKGYIRLPLNRMLIELQHGNDILVYYTDEFRSTIVCSFCYKRQFVSPSPDRFLRCVNCRNVNLILPPPQKWRTSRTKSWLTRTAEEAAAKITREFNRDIGAARNILANGFSELITGQQPAPFHRGKRLSTTDDGPPTKRARKK